MPKWERRRLRLKKNHGWTSEPGCQIFVADRGAVRFDILRNWVVEPGEKGSIKVMDRTPPDDDCTLEMTIFYLRDDVDWSGLPVSRLAREVGPKDLDNPVEVLERYELKEFTRDGMEVAWLGKRYIDADEGREAHSRLLVARKWNIQPLITFAFWADRADRGLKAWDVLLKTLILGDYVEDPTQRV